MCWVAHRDININIVKRVQHSTKLGDDISIQHSTKFGDDVSRSANADPLTAFNR